MSKNEISARMFMVTCACILASCNLKESGPRIDCQTPCPTNLAARKILILGNSITQHGPLPTDGWLGNWGMAASAIENDFVHVTMDSLQEYCPCVNLDFKAINIAYWEKDFEFDFSTEVLTSELHNYGPDILIIRLGENIPEEYARNHDYAVALAKLIDRFKRTDGHVLITGNFWPNSFKDEIQKRVAEANQYEYVMLSDLAGDETNKALDRFQGGIGQHPSDKGMKSIADRIAGRILIKNWYVDLVK